jgi:hypothetical protein
MRITIILLFFSFLARAQQYDLVVTSNMDSIACHLKNVTEDTIHFEMKANYEWIKQSTPKHQVIEFSYKTIDSDLFRFRKGSTIIKRGPSGIKNKKEIVTTFDNPRNSIVASFLGLSYARTIPFKNNLGLNLGVGLSFFEGRAMAESTLLFGSTKYFFEPGVNILFLENETEVLPVVGFRYQNPNGFLFKISATYISFINENRSYAFFLPILSLGYSF